MPLKENTFWKHCGKKKIAQSEQYFLFHNDFNDYITEPIVQMSHCFSSDDFTSFTMSYQVTTSLISSSDCCEIKITSEQQLNIGSSYENRPLVLCKQQRSK